MVGPRGDRRRERHRRCSPLIDPPYGADEFGAWAAIGRVPRRLLRLRSPVHRRRAHPAPPRHRVAVRRRPRGRHRVRARVRHPAGVPLPVRLDRPHRTSGAPSSRTSPSRSAIVVGYAARLGPVGILTGFGVAVLSVGFSMALGLWITRIAQLRRGTRSRLLDELQAAQGQLAAMHREAGVTDERGRLAREIHDTIAQSLTGLVMVAQRAGNRSTGSTARPRHPCAATSSSWSRWHARRSPRRAGSSPRSRRSSPTPGSPRRCDGSPTASSARPGVAVTVTADAAGLDRELEVVLLRCAQEALANVRKHAKARTATVDGGRPTRTTRSCSRSSDDGVGPGDAAPASTGSASPASATAPPSSAARSSSARAGAAGTGCASSCPRAEPNGGGDA